MSTVGIFMDFVSARSWVCHVSDATQLALQIKRDFSNVKKLSNTEKNLEPIDTFLTIRAMRHTPEESINSFDLSRVHGTVI